MNISRIFSGSLIWIGRLGLAITLFFVGLIVAWSVLRFYPGDRLPVVRWVGFAAPWIMLWLVPGIFIALVKKKYWLVGLIGLILAGGLWRYSPLIPRQPTVEANSDKFTLRVMTYNINISNRNVVDIVSLISSESPDVIAFQEVTEEFASVLQPELASEYPYYLLDTSWPLPIALMSRYPLKAQSVPSTVYRVQHATMEIPVGTITIWNVHPLAALVKDWDSQYSTMQAVAREVAQDSNPVLVMGDFNSTPQNETYYLIANELIDVHWTVGSGFGFTLPDYSQNQTPDSPPLAQTLLRFGPVVRSDHIFVSEHFIPLETHVTSTSGRSDHRPVIATLALVQQ